MDLSFTSEQIAFRQEVRDWIKSAILADLREKAEVDGNFEHREVMQWHKILAIARDGSAPHWPSEYGGPGLDATSRFILTEELELAGAPHAEPLRSLQDGGTAAHAVRERTPRRSASCRRSSPVKRSGARATPSRNAGQRSRLSLKLRAEDDGQWSLRQDERPGRPGRRMHSTPTGYSASARTEPSAKKQEGIGFILVDMKTPGVTAKPFLTTGGTPAFSETFFENAVVPKENPSSVRSPGAGRSPRPCSGTNARSSRPSASRRGPSGASSASPARRCRTARASSRIRASGRRSLVSTSSSGRFRWRTIARWRALSSATCSWPRRRRS